MDGPLTIDQDLHGNALDVSAAALTSRETDAERHRQSEIARIRSEIMDIAREVAELRRYEYEDLARAALPNNGGPLRPRKAAGNEPPKNPPHAPHIGAPESRTRLHAPPPPVSNGRRSQLVERAHRKSRVGNAETASNAAPARAERPPLTIREEVSRFAPTKPKPPARRARAGRWSVATKAAFLTGVMLAGTGVITLALWGKLPWPAHERQTLLLAETTASVPAAKVARSSQLQLASVADEQPATYPFEVPETYGVYAVSDGHLTPLEPLPIRVPDARVAISSAISKPAPAPLATGNLQFAVYHRELATNVPESASVRIVAKVMQATTFVGGKPKSVPVEDTWAVRGGSIDFRIAPVAANKEMILIRPADPAFTLSPGRYVLTFRNQAYDFSIAGTVSDTAHCLERSDLQDKSVYSECRELPASGKL
jgi:hypothetical protein